ncbi:MAG: hydantoinase/oxoprolinase family protein [Rhodospirillales bacterium]|jgi:N-methylhydantoinase A/acetophenone carboxylase|nr:acetophenone carboxylase [Rhodospirillaceae bacterium]MDP6427619.1 hydantoinase/oxoprolinase family protein [Rhodospirillales bacterium]MDP6645926.1 hydantoinase/oxoprolinase family protein [Rhodospirillales bacterium]MDP6841573.1 hydantoinase/oxoprolinase family protein [Rhodospirillales bacterium]
MTATINVDIGGTFTDCYVCLEDGRTAYVKTPTTGHRLSVGFMRGLEAAAGELGMSVEEQLASVGTVQYSTTVAMNTLLQRKGPKLAFIATEGHQDVLRIAKGASWMDAAVIREIRNVARITKPKPLIDQANVFAVRERLDCFGEIVRPLDEDHFLEGLRGLVDDGVRGFVVCLLFAYLNPVHERRIRELIESEYPEVYLGAMPIMLSSDVAPKRWEYTRANTAILNAYLHQSMWEELAGMGDELRERGYRGAMMMVHNTGGMAEVYRTSAVQTFNGGPVAGLIGGAAVGKRLGHDNILVTDMGGTSFDIGLVVHGATRAYDFRPVIDRFWVDMSILETRSIGAGGGSVAWVNRELDNRLEVGPEGAGSMPGPAAYGLGGTRPTVTDADLILGYLNAENYFGGDMILDRDLAEDAINTEIAEPLGISVIEAARRIRRIVDANMADVIARETFLRGFDPKDFILFSFGGAGPTHCIGYASEIGIERMLIFPFSPIFCAWGAATMPLAHIYEMSQRVELIAPNTRAATEEYTAFNRIAERLEADAARDLTGAGYDPKDAAFSLELDMKYGGQIHLHRTASPVLRLTSAADVQALSESFEQQYSDFFSPQNIYPEGGVEIHNFVLRAEMPAPDWELPAYPLQGPSPENALIGERPVYWGGDAEPLTTPLYRQSLLQAGNALSGPAIVEADYTTVVVDPGYALSVDEHLNLVLCKERE